MLIYVYNQYMSRLYSGAQQYIPKGTPVPPQLKHINEFTDTYVPKSPQKSLRLHLTEQYYKYMQLVRMTNNFQYFENVIDNVNWKEYNQKIAIFGFIQSVDIREELGIVQFKVCTNLPTKYFPKFSRNYCEESKNGKSKKNGKESPQPQLEKKTKTQLSQLQAKIEKRIEKRMRFEQNLFRSPMTNNIRITRESETYIRRKIIISFDAYAQEIVKYNNFVELGKKKLKKDVKTPLMWTNLKILLKEEDAEIVYGYSQKTEEILIKNDFYYKYLDPLFLERDYDYSTIDINEIQSPEYLQTHKKRELFTIQKIRNLCERYPKYPIFIGLIKRAFTDTLKTMVNPKQCEIVLQIMQDVFCPFYDSIGVATIILRYDKYDVDYMREYIKEGCVYGFIVSDIYINQKMTPLFRVAKKENVIRYTREPVYMNIQQKERKMKEFRVDLLYQPIIFRNVIKVKVHHIVLKFLYGKVICEKCNQVVQYDQDVNRFVCQNNCKFIIGELRLWAIVGVANKGGYLELTLEDQCVLDYFEVGEFQETLKYEIAKHDKNRKGLVLYFKKSENIQLEEDEQNVKNYNQKIYEQSDQILHIMSRILLKYLQKWIIGVPIHNTNHNFQTFDYNIKQEFQVTYAKKKDFIKNIKMNLNGHMKYFDGRQTMVPYIKVRRVYEVYRERDQ